MGLFRGIRKVVVLGTMVGGVFVAYQHTDGFGSIDHPDTTSAPSVNEKARENTTKYSPDKSSAPTTSEVLVGPKSAGPILPPTTAPSNLRSITVMISGTNCIFVDDATGEQVHSLEEGEVVNLSTNQNGAGFVGVDGGNFANEYTLAVKLSTSKEPVQLKFGTSIAAQCQDATDYAKLTEEPHQATTDAGKATIPVTEPLSKALLNGETLDIDAFKNTDIVTQIEAARIQLPELK